MHLRTNLHCASVASHQLSHGLVHEADRAFDVLPYGEQVEHLKTSKSILEGLSGKEVISFRAPALRVNKET